MTFTWFLEKNVHCLSQGTQACIALEEDDIPAQSGQATKVSEKSRIQMCFWSIISKCLLLPAACSTPSDTLAPFWRSKFFPEQEVQSLTQPSCTLIIGKDVSKLYTWDL